MLIPFSGKLSLEPNSSQRQLHPFHLGSLLFPAAVPPPSCGLRQLKSCLCPVIDPLLGPQEFSENRGQTSDCVPQGPAGFELQTFTSSFWPLATALWHFRLSKVPWPFCHSAYYPLHKCIFLPFPDIHTPTLEQRNCLHGRRQTLWRYTGQCGISQKSLTQGCENTQLI